MLSLHSVPSMLSLSSTPTHYHHLRKNLNTVNNSFVDYNSWNYFHEPLPSPKIPSLGDSPLEAEGIIFHCTSNFQLFVNSVLMENSKKIRTKCHLLLVYYMPHAEVSDYFPIYSIPIHLPSLF